MGDVSFDVAKAPLHWRRRFNELRAIDGRRCEIETELSRELNRLVELRSVGARRSYDEVFYAVSGPDRLGVVRVNSPAKPGPSMPAGDSHLVVPLQTVDRLDREWGSYVALSPDGLSPKPLWRCEDAIACEWLAWSRMSDLVRDPAAFWATAERVVPAVRRMHDAGVTHLDLNPGNVLLESGGDGVAFIDFEFAAADWAYTPLQQAYDYLRLTSECLRPRRGGRQLTADPTRWTRLLAEAAPAAARSAKLILREKRLQRLAENEAVFAAVQAVFPKVATL